MTEPRLFDAVTLRHFGCIDRLSVLERLLVGTPVPRWVDAVRSEVLAGMGNTDCANVLAAGFLGQPYEVTDARDTADVFRTRTALSDGRGASNKHLGEAESIVVADRLDGVFVTDDLVAYDYAGMRLGHSRVLDTVDLLREAVRLTVISAAEAALLADAIRNSGRHLRKGRPSTMTSAYFETDD
jgi:hypothetical protein